MVNTIHICLKGGKNMKKKMILTFLSISIIVLIPISIANIIEMDQKDKINKRLKIESLDDDTEIISILTGSCQWSDVKGFVKNKPIDLCGGKWGEALDLGGIKKSNGIFNHLYRGSAYNLKAEHFIGFIYENKNDYLYFVWGIIIGPIEWN
jgi:hypothetical protein